MSIIIYFCGEYNSHLLDHKPKGNSNKSTPEKSYYKELIISNPFIFVLELCPAFFILPITEKQDKNTTIRNQMINKRFQ